MALAFLFDPNKQFQNPNGTNAVGGFLRVFLNGTDDSATTYKDFNGTLNEADIELDANGRAVVIVDNTKTYRIEVYSFGGTLMWTVNNFTAQGSSGGGCTPVSVEGTEGEVDVDSYSSGGILHFVVGLAQTIKDTLTSLSSSVTSLMASIGLCELVSNKKDTLTGYEASTTDYPSIKAVVDFVNSAMQNMGGKLITDNGNPFTDSSDLPSTTPYNGVNIDDKDYAYVQNAGSAERWSATVVGSSVAWVQEYAINIPVFTPAQQAAIDSGATSTKISNYDSHITDTSIHVTTSEKNTWNAKQNTLPTTGTPSSTFAINVSGAAGSVSTAIGSGEIKLIGVANNVAGNYQPKMHPNIRAYYDNNSNGNLLLVGSERGTSGASDKGGIRLSGGSGFYTQLQTADFTEDRWHKLPNESGNLAVTTGTYPSMTVGSATNATNHINNGNVHVTTSEKNTWNAKQNAISDLTEIRSGAAAGATALQPNGNGSNVTSTFTAASSRTNISSGEKLSTIFGKIAKWFYDLKSVAFTGNYSDLSGTPTIPAAANNGVLTIKQNGTSKGTFSANQSGNATITLTDTTYENKVAAEGSPDVSLVTAGDKFDWNLSYRQLFKLTKYVTGSEATQGTAIELGEYSYGPGHRLRFTISIEDTSSDYTLGINILFSTGVNQQWNGWLANSGNYEYCAQTEYRVGSSSPDFGVFGNSGTFPGIGKSKRIGDITIPRFSTGGIPVGMYRGKFLISGYSGVVKSFVLDVDLCYKCANSETTWWGYVSLLPNDMHT